MTRILAHRGNILGPAPASENRLPAIDAALAGGWGVETDIRRTPDGTFYLSHDAVTSSVGLEAVRFCERFRAHPQAEVALNVKELGYEAQLVDFLVAQHVDAQVFLFDMELLEPTPGRTAQLLRELHPTIRLAARVSDRGEPVSRALASSAASVIWLDEFDGPWTHAADIRQLRDAGYVVYAVSPELHGFPLEAARSRWDFFCQAGVDGICTDHPFELEARLARSGIEGTS